MTGSSQLLSRHEAPIRNQQLRRLLLAADRPL
jgi:hypothetical protein